MTNIKRIFLFSLILLSGAAGTVSAQDFLADKILVKVRDTYRSSCSDDAINADQLPSILRESDITRVSRMFRTIPIEKNPEWHSDISLLYELTYSGTDVEGAIAALQKTKYFEYAEPYFIYRPMYYPNDSLADTALLGDIQYQDALWMHRLYEAWDVTKGDTNIVVGISDTGVKIDHEDLQGNIQRNYADPIDGIDNDNDGFIDNYLGWDFADGDNDPKEYTGSHGTAVAGIVAATPDNTIGVAGQGFNTRYVAMKATPDASPGSITHGYQTVQFAAAKGYDVINLSWGCVDCYSQALQDIVDYAVLDRDMVITASGGNQDIDQAVYPASYDNVISVTSINSTFAKQQNKSWHYYIDMVADGAGVVSTQNNGGYGIASGTSYSSPMAAAAAALVKDVFPNYSALQIMEQIRVTANDTIYTIPANAPFQDKLGKGALDVYEAVTNTTTPAIRNTQRYHGDSIYFTAGDTATITGTFVNYLNPTASLSIHMSSPSPYLIMIDSVLNPGVMTMMDTFQHASTPFRFYIDPNCPVNEEIWLRFEYFDGTYYDFQYLPTVLNPDYITIDENNIMVTVNSTGNFGYNIPNRDLGVGLRHNDSPSSLLFEGGLMLSTDPLTVSNNIRKSSGVYEEDFHYSTVIKEENAGGFADFKASSVFNDTVPSGPDQNVGVSVRQNYYAWSDAPNENFIIAEYEITNINAFTVQNLHAGLFADWDLASSNRDIARWDTLGFGYVKPQGNGKWAGIKPLWPYYGKYYAIDNDQDIAGNTFGIYDDFTDAEKHLSLSAGAVKITSGGVQGGDVSHTVSVNMGDFVAGESKTIAFAIMAGDNLNDLQEAALAAQTLHGQPTFLLTPGPDPIADISVCKGRTATIEPQLNDDYLLYQGQHDYLVLDTGMTMETLPIEDTTTYYIAYYNPPFPTAKTPVKIIPYQPEVDFVLEPDSLYLADRFIVYSYNTSPDFISSFWDMGNGTTASTSIGSAFYQTPGSYQVTLTIEDSDNCPNTLSKPLAVFAGSEPDGIAEITSSIRVYPTLVHTTVTIENVGTAGHVRLLDATGAIIRTDRLQRGMNVLDLSELPEGMYYLQTSGMAPVKIVKL